MIIQVKLIGVYILKRIFYGNNEYQFAELRLPKGEGPYPVAIVIHGGFWRAGFGLELMDHLSDDLTSRGIATWNIEYRRVGQEGGGWPGTLSDAAHAADYLHTVAEDYHLNLSKVVTIGHSAGGHLAVWLAARHNLPTTSELYSSNPLSLVGAFSLAGVLDLELMEEVHHIPEDLYQSDNNPVRDLLGGRPSDVPERYAEASPRRLLPISVPLVLVHGGLDVNVPIGMSQLFKEQAHKAGDLAELITFPEAEHFKLIQPDSREWPIIVNHVKRMVGIANN